MAVRASPVPRVLMFALPGLVAAGVLTAGAPAALGAALRVTSVRDELVNHDGKCSLREAIATVNSPGRRTDCGRAGRRSNTIVLRAARYRLTIAPAGSDDNTSGDLNLTGRLPLTIVGAGTRATVLTARGLGDRVIAVAGGARLTLTHLTVAGGRAAGGSGGAACARGGAGASGGGLVNLGNATLKAVLLTGNRAGAGGPGGNAGASPCASGNGGPGGSGGGIYSTGTLALIRSTVEGNAAGSGGSGGAGTGNLFRMPGRGGSGGPGGSGGAIYSRGKLTVTDSSIYGNRAGAGGAGGPGGGSEGRDGPGGPGGSGGAVFSSVGRLRLVNSTLSGNSAGIGGAGGGPGGPGGAVAVLAGSSLVRNATLAGNQAGAGGPAGATTGGPGREGSGGALYVRSRPPMRLQNTIVAASPGSACSGGMRSPIEDDGHDLSYRARGCPGHRANPRLGPLRNYGGPTKTMALGRGSPAIGRVPRRHGGCPATDQRGVSRPQARGCDIGAYEFAVPKITILAPFHGASYEHGSRIRARFRCGEGGVASTIARCRGTVARGHPIPTGRVGARQFSVTAVDRSGNRTRRVIHYGVWKYVNPLRRVSGLTPRRIDLGVDYAGSGPLLALGRGRVTMASDTDSGPSSCWAISCWPGGGIVVYRLLDGPYAGRYVYVAEHITVNVRTGQTVRAGQRIATLYSGYPWSEWGWAAGPGPEALAMADGHRCTCSDPGGWSTIEGRNMNALLVRLGAPSGYLQAGVPNQSMPRGWPSWPQRNR